MRKISSILEKSLFGVCSGIADYMGVRSRHVRLSFIYFSFLTFGSPILAYLIVAFWKRNSKIWKPWTWRNNGMEL